MGEIAKATGRTTDAVFLSWAECCIRDVLRTAADVTEKARTLRTDADPGDTSPRPLHPPTARAGHRAPPAEPVAQGRSLLGFRYTEPSGDEPHRGSTCTPPPARIRRRLKAKATGRPKCA